MNEIEHYVGNVTRFLMRYWVPNNSLQIKSCLISTVMSKSTRNVVLIMVQLVLLGSCTSTSTFMYSTHFGTKNSS